jgi:peptidoglycan/xylan/chitin deacetylase (PgdA/CDA1 family)
MLTFKVRASSRPALVLAATAALLVTCDGDIDPEDIEPVPEPAGPAVIAEPATVTNPQIDFSPTPSYLAAKSVVLTFDDGPDSTNTAKVLDILKTNALKVTFFINTINYTDVNTDPNAQALVKRIVNEGHFLGNHTVHHPDLATLSDTDVEAEIAGVETTVANVFGAPRRMTLFRAPFGSPFDPNGDTSELPRVAPIVGKHAVHIGWNITPQDFACPDATCVFNNVTNELKAGHYGIVLLHSTQPQTVAALQNIINFCKSNGYTFRSVEDAVVGKYGAPSGDLIGSGSTDVTRTASADAYVRDGDSANTNFGTATSLVVKKSSTGFNRVSYVKFSISNLTGVTAAKLQMWGKLGSSGSVPVAVGPVATTSWSETGITWNNKPAIGSALATGAVSSTTLTKLEFNVGTYVKNQRAAGKTVVSFAVQGTTNTSAVASFNSREAASNKPRLVITQ